MIETIKNLASDSVAQFVTAFFVGFIIIAFVGELMVKSEWVRSILIGEEGGAE